MTNTHLQLLLKPFEKTLVYCAGQYLLLQYPDGQFMPFSIANAPHYNQEIELHIRVAENDQTTQQFVQGINENRPITIQGPMGDCCYTPQQSGELILIAAGTGFAPAKAIIEQLCHLQVDKPCYLYWTVKRRSDLYLPDLPTLWQKTLSNFHFVPTITLSDESNKSNVLDAVIKDFPNLTTTQVYIFGPRSLALDALKRFTKKGLSSTHFFTDVLSKEEVLAFK